MKILPKSLPDRQTGSCILSSVFSSSSTWFQGNMATSETKENICLVCLEAPAVRKVDTCEHSYCEKCLSSPKFSCPQCVTEEAEDQGADRTGGHVKEKKPGGSGSKEPATKDQVKTTNNCKICHFNGNTVKSTHVCIKCRKLPLCANCAVAHRQNEATQNHVLTVLARARDDQCIVHDEPLVLLCTSCSENVCHVCISIEHVGHNIESIHKVVFVEFDKVRTGMEYQERSLEMLKCDEKFLQESKATAHEMEDLLIKSIEDHAEKCIEEIIKSKEALKKQVRDDFKVVRVMEKRLEAMPELQRVSRDIAAAANQLLNEQAELHSTYVEKLIGLKQQLDKLKEDHLAYEEDKAKYRQTFKSLCEQAITFYPRSPNCKIGGFQDLYTEPRCDAGGPCVCETCERKADVTRVVKCRQIGTCTCGSVDYNYRCEGRITCNGCGKRQRCRGPDLKCENRITVSNFIP